ncbi:dynein assembly factor 3, axonemal-like [Pomacea canaliculata]|uniref:dynein assembly factor 3, axonemal-like n=1 Tax=Pomacea canaliculata TaxID=400727 RepID=UPI000D72C07E|nr:dynein assembly factor 3, axonemal-like [Pomacea canaliculata]
MDGFGTITWWGFSPALDLQEMGVNQLMNKLAINKNKDTIRLLIIGSGDLRHVLTTLAHCYRHPQRKLHFYIVESSLELYARHMLLLTVALEAQKRMGLQEKTELFLELFGNILVRKQTADYIQKMAPDFIKMVTDFNYLEKKLPCLDLSHLKFKERDFMEGIFKFWRKFDLKAFDAKKCWDLRLRQYLGVRYDSRLNVFDWDHSMNLIERGGDIVNIHEYKSWRNNGVAFQVREGTYDVPNLSLASTRVLKHEGDRFVRLGYWGDILVSPYIALGTESEEKSFFKKQNGVYAKCAQDVAEFNVMSMFHELATHQKYLLTTSTPGPVTDKRCANVIERITEELEANGIYMHDHANPEMVQKIEEEEEADADLPQAPSSDKIHKGDHEEQEGVTGSSFHPLDLEYESLALDGVTITFLPIGSAPELPKRGKFQKTFDVVYIANSLVHYLTPEFNAVFADHCTVLLESALFMLELKKEQVAQFVQKVSEMAKAAGCQELEKCDAEKDALIKMYFQR